MESRGRSLDGVLQQYERFVKPATEQFVNFLRYMQSASYSGRPRAGHLGREY